MSNHSAGHEAEQHAAKYLEQQGYKILAINWRTKLCEIDIVAKKSEVVYLVEVKYRASESFGSGFDYITPKKLTQMRFAAELWASSSKWAGNYQMAAMELSGADYEIKQFLPDL